MPTSSPFRKWRTRRRRGACSLPSHWHVEVSSRPVPHSNRTCRERPEALLGHLATGFAIRRGIDYRREADLSALGKRSPFDRWGSAIAVRDGERELHLLSVHLRSGCWGAGEDGSASRASTCRARGVVSTTRRSR